MANTDAPAGNPPLHRRQEHQRTLGKFRQAIWARVHELAEAGPGLPAGGWVEHAPIRREGRNVTDHSADGAQAPSSQERPTAELVKQLSEQVSVLVRDELKLAQLEMTRKGKQAGVGAGMLGGGGLITLYGVGCLIACAILALNLALAAWLSALIVGVVLLAARRVSALPD